MFYIVPHEGCSSNSKGYFYYLHFILIILYRDITLLINELLLFINESNSSAFNSLLASRAKSTTYAKLCGENDFYSKGIDYIVNELENEYLTFS